MTIMIAVQEQRPCGAFGERDSSSSDTIQNTTAVSYRWATIPDAKRPEEHCG